MFDSHASALQEGVYQADCLVACSFPSQGSKADGVVHFIKCLSEVYGDYAVSRSIVIQVAHGLGDHLGQEVVCPASPKAPILVTF